MFAVLGKSEWECLLHVSVLFCGEKFCGKLIGLPTGAGKLDDDDLADVLPLPPDGMEGTPAKDGEVVRPTKLRSLPPCDVEGSPWVASQTFTSGVTAPLRTAMPPPDLHREHL